MSSSVFSTEAIPDFGVHTGFWVNWSRGKFLGSTLTLNQRDGGLLVSFLALFVSFVGTAVWRISCFIFHQCYSSNAPRDGIYHQRQALLRNSANGASGLWMLGQMIWAWRKSKSYIRLFPLAMLTITCVAAFAVAGIFSSKIATSTGTEVLVSSPNCGIIWVWNDFNYKAISSVLNPYIVRRKKTFVNYSQQCYSNVTNTENCGIYVRKQLPTTIDRNASCPFPQRTFCLNDHGNIKLDTGLLDSNNDLGINSAPQDRFQFRRIWQCAPMAKKGFTNKTTVQMSDGSRVPYLMHYYGKPTVPLSNMSQYPQGNTTDPYTYMYPELFVDRFWTERDRSSYSEYTLASLVAKYSNGSLFVSGSEFEPLPGLGHSDRDLVLLFLSANEILFQEGTNDPWYSAHRDAGNDFSYKTAGGVGPDDTVRFYFADDAASAVGCTKQMQVCNPNAKTPDGRCTRLGTLRDIDDDLIPQHFWSSKLQRQMFGLFRDLVLADNVELNSMVEVLGSLGLASKDSVLDGTQGPIPDYQWQLDIENMHSASLSIIQGNIFDFAAGPSDPSVMKWLRKGTIVKDWEYLCKNQKIRSTAYTSFNAFGLCFTLAVGTALLAVSYTLEAVVGWAQARRSPAAAYARLEWCVNETLQLQRLAHEELGLGGRWKGAAGAVPVTEEGGDCGGYPLAVVDVADPKHPRLKAPRLDVEAPAGGEGGREDGAEGKERTSNVVVGERSSVSLDAEEEQGRQGDGRPLSQLSGGR